MENDYGNFIGFEEMFENVLPADPEDLVILQVDSDSQFEDSDNPVSVIPDQPQNLGQNLSVDPVGLDLQAELDEVQAIVKLFETLPEEYEDPEPPSPSVTPDPMGKTENSGRFKRLTTEELATIEKHQYSDATMRNTKWGMGVFNAWCMETRSETTDMENIEEGKLAQLLRQFYAEAQPGNITSRAKKMEPELATEYHKNTMKNIRGAMNRHLKDIGRNVDIVSGPSFACANKMLNCKLKQNLKAGTSRGTAHHPVIAPEELAKINDYLCQDSPVALRFRVWYLLAIHFVSRGTEFHKQLKISSLVVSTDSTGQEYVTINHETLQKNHQGGSSVTGEETTDKRMYATGTNICPVESVKSLLQKSAPDAVALFNQCSKASLSNPSTTDLWYTNQQVKDKAFSTFMPDICKNAGTNRYTAHSLRATAIKGLSDAGFENRQIMFLSDHKSELSLKHYTRTPSIPQKRAMSEVLGSVSAGMAPPLAKVQALHRPAIGMPPSTIRNESGSAPVATVTTSAPVASESVSAPVAMATTSAPIAHVSRSAPVATVSNSAPGNVTVGDSSQSDSLRNNMEIANAFQGFPFLSQNLQQNTATFHPNLFQNCTFNF